MNGKILEAVEKHDKAKLNYRWWMLRERSRTDVRTEFWSKWVQAEVRV